MTFTYTNDPANSNRDAVRVLINDITESSNSLSDETIAWLLAQNSNVWYAAADGADMFASLYAGDVTEKQVGDLKVKVGGGDPVARWRQRADDLRAKGAIKGFTAYSGGISIADKNSELEDSDRLPDQAYIGQHDNHDTGASSSTSGRWDF